MMLPLAFALLAGQTAPASAPPQRPEQGQTIIVTGQSLKETERALAQCLARQCPPDQDIAATLAHAENLFVAGRYADAWRATHASIARNGGRGKEYPVPVSDLYRADGRIALHLGEREPFTSATLAMKRALAAGLPRNDVRLLGADMEVAAMYTSVRDLDAAARAYKDLEREAHALGRDDIAGAARVRQAWLLNIAGLSWLARQELKRIAADGKEAEANRASARALLASLDREKSKGAGGEAIAAAARSAQGPTPVLLYQPQLDLPQVTTMEAGSTLRLMATENFEDRWIDVGFRVTPEGKVAELEILRSHGPVDWTPPLIKAIAGRLYSRIANPEGTYRIERYTYTSFWTDMTGSRLRRRSPNARIEYLDLTADRPKQGG
jgi:hypothetical protein